MTTILTDLTNITDAVVGSGKDVQIFIVKCSRSIRHFSAAFKMLRLYTVS